MAVDELSPRVFGLFRDLVYEKAGIHLGPQKEALVAARVGKRLRALGLPSYEAYYDWVRADESGDEVVEMLNAISTNVTRFYREPRHFEIMESLMRDWWSAGQRTFRIWCAAASTGEEPYSIAMTARLAIPDVSDFRILATDISTRALTVARMGRYRSRDVEHIPVGSARRFLRRDADADTDAEYVVDDGIRRMVSYARLNLAYPPFPMRGPFDMVFCRNVMIYFDNRVRRALLDEVVRLLRPGGYLMVGHAESLSGLLSNLRTVEPSVYMR